MKLLSYKPEEIITNKKLKEYHKFFLGEKKEINVFDIYSKKINYPKIIEESYAGEVLERFHEIGLMPGHEDFHSFLIASTTTLFNDSIHNTNQLTNYGDKLLEHLGNEDEVFSDNLVEAVYIMNKLYKEESNMSNDDLKDILKNIKKDNLSLQNKKDLLAMTYIRVVKSQSYSSDAYINGTRLNYKRTAILAYILSYFSEEDYKSLSRNEKVLFITGALFVQALRKLKKSEYGKNEFLYKLASKSSSLLRKEYSKTTNSEKNDYLKNIAYLEYEEDLIALHFEMMNMLFLKKLNENAYSRLMNVFRDLLSNISENIYNERYDLIRNILLEESLINKSARIYINTDNFNKESYLFDFIYFYISAPKRSLYLNLDINLNNDDAVKIYKKTLKTNDISLKVLKEIFIYHKYLNHTKENALLVIDFLNKYNEILKGENLDKENNETYLNNLYGNFKTDTINLLLKSEKDGYKKDNPYILKELNLNVFLEYMINLKKPLDFLKSEHYSEKEKYSYMYIADFSQNLNFAKDYEKEDMILFIGKKLESIALFNGSNYLSELMNIYDNLLELENEKFIEVEKELYLLLESINKLDLNQKECFSNSRNLNRYFIQNKEEAQQLIKGMTIFDSYKLSVETMRILNKNLRMLGDYLNDEDLLKFFMDKYKYQLRESMRGSNVSTNIKFILKINNSLKDKIKLFENYSEEIDLLIKEQIDAILPLFSNDLLFDFILKNKSENNVDTKVQV